MALTEATLQDRIEVVGEFKHVQVRTARVIYDDGVKISETFNRHVIAPGDDITNESADVQSVCLAVHTDEIKAAFAAHVAQTN